MANPAANAVMGDAAEAVYDGTAVARMTQWTFNPTSGISEWGDSDGGAFTNAKPTRKSGGGSVEGKLDSGSEVYDVFVPGDEPTLVLWINATLYYDLPCAVIGTFSLTLDQDSKEVVGWSSDFTASGVFYYPGEAGATVRSYPS